MLSRTGHGRHLKELARRLAETLTEEALRRAFREFLSDGDTDLPGHTSSRLYIAEAGLQRARREGHDLAALEVWVDEIIKQAGMSSGGRAAQPARRQTPHNLPFIPRGFVGRADVEPDLDGRDRGVRVGLHDEGRSPRRRADQSF